MVNPPRTRKRVHAKRRAPDGSAFQKCDCCGAIVPIALADMHECEAKAKKEVKRFKGVCGKPIAVKQGSICDQVRSPFRFFMESFVKTCHSGKWIDIDRKGFDAWRNMSKKEKEPYIIQAEKLNAAHCRTLLKELTYVLEVDDEADSAMVGKYDESCFIYEEWEWWDSIDFEILNPLQWDMVQLESLRNPHEVM